MPVKRCELTIDAGRRERDMRGTPMFPCGGYVSELNRCGFPWHWHEEIEVLFVHSGILRLHTKEMDFFLGEGEGAFINSNVLHSGQSVGKEGCTLRSFVFHGSLISGAAESVFEQRYVRPLLDCAALPGLALRREIEWQCRAVECVRDAFDAYEAERFGYELVVRENLSRLWYLIIQNMQAALKKQSGHERAETARIKDMLNFVHKHYEERLELSQISGAASVSERECLRCFQKTIGMPPMQYLMKYRISVAARLLTDTDAPISVICGQAGFESPSYFSKVFRNFMGCAPTAYRTKNRPRRQA